LIKKLDILLANICFLRLLKVPIENIFGIVGRILLEIWSESPKTSFYKSNLNFLVGLQLYYEPNIALMIKFIHKLDQRPSFDEFVAHFVLNMCQQMKKII